SNATLPSAASPLSLHDALPISFHSCQQSAQMLSWIVWPVFPPVGGLAICSAVLPHRTHRISAIVAPPLVFPAYSIAAETRRGRRSEEHTSELQSRFDLVCRLLL